MIPGPWARGPLSNLAGLAMAALLAVLLTAGLSNRVRRRLWRRLALLFHPSWIDSGGRVASAMAAVEREVSLSGRLRSLPAAVREAAEVEPVTVFAFDPARRAYDPVASTLAQVSADPIPLDEPLPALLQRGLTVLLLQSRDDDLENAPIHAVNARVIRACRAVCAVPLRQGKDLVGFMLCGGTGGGDRVGLASLARLERLARRLHTVFEDASRARSADLPRGSQQAPPAESAERHHRHRRGRAR